MLSNVLRSVLLISASLLSLQAAASDSPVVTATRLLDRLDAGQFDQAEASFGAQMKTAVPAERLRQVWKSLPEQMGAASGRGEAAVSAHDTVALIEIPLHYARGELLAKVAVAADGSIVGFLVQPAAPPAAAAPGPEANYREREFPIGQAPNTLAATLAVPLQGGPFAAVVLVHGSGPQDRDETIGGNRPFLDLARGLAARGIAVLRYEKRSKSHPEEFAGAAFTVDDETTNDAVAAVAALAKTPGINGKRIFVLGHSQGGLMAPRIAARSKQVAGIILLAAPARPILDLLAEQNRNLAKLDGKVSVEETAYLADLDQRIARVRGVGTVPLADTPMNLPAGYWRSIDSVDPIAEARALRLPMLLLQGGRDFQVPAADWDRWRGAFAKDARATFKHYPSLNHLAIAGTGPANIAEYQTAGHVDAGLIADIAQWLAKH